MDLGIQNRVALVAAAGGGLGRATAERLAMEGARVAICDKDTSTLDETRGAIFEATSASEVFAYPVDLTVAEEIQHLVEHIRRDIGPVSILVTNSGGPPPGTFDEVNDAQWEFAYQLTFLSAVRLIRAVLPDMKAQRWGRIINLTSRAIKEPISGLIISNGVRLAVAGMAKTLAGEVAKYNVTVNNVGPGTTMTARALELAGKRANSKDITINEELESIARNIPLGRLARPEEQAAAAAFLASELAGYITGVSLLVDGGAVRAL